VQNLANIQHKIFTEEILGNMRKTIPRPVQPTHTVDPLGTRKGASKSEGRNKVLQENLKTFKISQKDTERIQSKLTLKVLHEFANPQDRADTTPH